MARRNRDFVLVCLAFATGLVFNSEGRVSGINLAAAADQTPGNTPSAVFAAQPEATSGSKPAIGIGVVQRAGGGCVLTITCPADLTIECDQSTDPANTGTATYEASTECGTVTLTYSDITSPGSCPQAKSIARTWTATASSGETASCIQTITIVDSQAPEIQCPPDLSLNCLADVPDCAFGGVGVLDNCGGFFAVACSRSDNGGSGCPGDPLIFTDTFSSSDNCGNYSECRRTITVVDDVLPVISGCPESRTISCVSELPPCDPNVGALDNCDGSVQVTCTDGVLVGGSCGGSVTRTYFASDRCGNTAVCEQVFTIDDDTAPIITCPQDKQLVCGESTDPANTGSATATDNCGGSLTITYTDVILAVDCTGETGIDRTWQAIDDCGNPATCVQHITFTDLVPPELACPGDKQLLCGESTDPSNTGSATATDDCGGAVTITYTDAVVPANCTGLAGVDRTWTATDVCGNAAVCVQHITFVDITAPVVTTSPDIEVQNDSGLCGATVSFESSAVDECGGSMPVSCDWPSGSFFPTGTTTVTCSATDACGNTGSHGFNVTVKSCPCHRDPVCDSVLNILDVVALVEVAFRSQPAQEDACPDSREDVDCSGYVDIVDVVKMVNVAFRGVDPAIEFCNPCI